MNNSKRIADVGCNYLHHKKRQETERIELTPWFYYDIIKTKKRTIHAPSPELKKVQRSILRKYFKDHWRFNSVKYAASVHCGKKWLMKLDIKDFYNSISEEQIKDVIHKYVNSSPVTSPHLYGSQSSPTTAPLLLNDNVGEGNISLAEQIFSICTINGNLPTGAPTSPYIANLILREFDFEIEEICKNFDVNYSRYMDDLFFSTDKPQYILSLVELEVLKQFKELGFEVNVDKIKYISSNKRQQVLGLGVNNNKPVLTKEDKRKYRTYFYNLLFPIQYSKIKQYKDHERELLGHLAYIKSVDIDYYKRIVVYILNLINRWNINNKQCLRKLLKTLSKV